MKLVLLHGAPGVGKLSVGRELQALTGYGLFHNHLTVDMVAAVFDFSTPPFVELRERIWLDVLGRAAEEQLDGVIFTVVFEPTVAPGFFERLSDRITEAGGTVYPVELRCSVEQNQLRIASAERRQFLKMTDPQDLKAAALAGEFDPPLDLPGNLIIDTTELTPRQTARRILQHLIELEP